MVLVARGCGGNRKIRSRHHDYRPDPSCQEAHKVALEFSGDGGAFHPKRDLPDESAQKRPCEIRISINRGLKVSDTLPQR